MIDLTMIPVIQPGKDIADGRGQRSALHRNDGGRLVAVIRRGGQVDRVVRSVLNPGQVGGLD